MREFLRVVGLAVAVAASACGSSVDLPAGDMACLPAQSVACVGPGGCSGGQVCLASGLGYEPCVCAAGDATISDDDVGDVAVDGAADDVAVVDGSSADTRDSTTSDTNTTDTRVSDTSATDSNAPDTYAPDTYAPDTYAPDARDAAPADADAAAATDTADAATKADSAPDTTDARDTATSDTADASKDSSDASSCVSPPTATLAQFFDPASPQKASVDSYVRVTGVIATSRKWRVSGAPTKLADSCLFGMFVADPNATFQPYSGVLVVSFGTPAVPRVGGGYECLPGTDYIPESVAPGARFDLVGHYELYGPTSLLCSGAGEPFPDPGKVRELVLGSACTTPLTSAGTATVPAAAVIANENDLSTGAEVQKWMGGRVKIENVEATSGLSFGRFTILNSTLAISDRIYYRGAATAPNVTSGVKFTSITGLSMLDFCTWVLMPNACSDMVADPSSPTVCP